MSTLKYKIKGTENQRWGIYLQDRLLATIGNYEACQYLWEYLNNNLSDRDSSRAILAYEKAIAKY